MVIIKYFFVALLTVPPAIFAWSVYKKWISGMKKLNKIDAAKRRESRR